MPTWMHPHQFSSCVAASSGGSPALSSQGLGLTSARALPEPSAAPSASVLPAPRASTSGNLARNAACFLSLPG